MTKVHFNEIETGYSKDSLEVTVNNAEGIRNYKQHIWVGRAKAYIIASAFIVAIIATRAYKDTEGNLFTLLLIGAILSTIFVLFTQGLYRENRATVRGTLDSPGSLQLVKRVTIYNYNASGFSEKTTEIGGEFIELYKEVYAAWQLKENFPKDFNWAGLQSTLFTMATTIKQISNGDKKYEKVQLALSNEMTELKDSFAGYLSSAQESHASTSAIQQHIVEEETIRNLQDSRFTL